MKRQNSGFSLLELVATLAVLAILIAMVAPTFQGMIYNSRQTSAVNELIRAIHLARSEAAKRASTVNLSAIDALDGGTENDSNEWGKGWRLWYDADDDNTLDTGEEILAYVDFPAKITLESDRDTTLIAFSSTGRITLKTSAGSVVTTTNEFFRVCDSRSGENGKKVTLSTMGQPTTITITSSDANHCS